MKQGTNMTISREVEYDKDNEIFRQIDNTIYSVSTHGRVRNNKTMKFLTPRNFKGYARVSLWFNKKGNDKRIHRLVLTAFRSNPLNKTEINHKNGIRNDNRLCNLEWVTPKENSEHKYKFLKQPSAKGENNANSKLSEKNVLDIRSSSEDTKTLAKKYNIARAYVYRVQHKETWSHI